MNNLDVVLMEAHGVLESLPASLLATIERAVLLILGPRASASTSLPGALKAFNCGPIFTGYATPQLCKMCLLLTASATTECIWLVLSVSVCV